MRATLLASSLLLGSALAVPVRPRLIKDRQAGQTYDYVVVGCGASGLTVSMRLTEDESVSVLCIEAGPFDDYEELIQFPQYIGAQPYGFYDWEIYTAPQTQLDGASRLIPMGKGVGGGTLINGMVWSRGNQVDINTWDSLGATGWTWDSLLPYFKKAETYTPKTYPGSYQPVESDTSDYGTSGPVQVSYPNYLWSQTTNWFKALNAAGIPTVADPNNGLEAGGYFLPNDINAINQTRADARRSYYDPYAGRPNYHVMAQSQVTKILFSGSGTLHATGVQYSSGSVTSTVYASREVILAAGAVHSPQLLQLSGIGPASLLKSFGIQVLKDLPGVGSNLQDHPMIHLNYSYSKVGLTPFNDMTTEYQQEYISSKTGPWTAKPSTGVAFPSLEQVTSQASSLISAANDDGDYYPDTYDSTLQTGFAAQKKALLSILSANSNPAFEILNNNAGGLDLCLMHPLSRGTVLINSANPFATPGVDPRWLVNPFDFNAMILAMQFNQVLINTPALQALGPTYSSPSQNAGYDELSGLLKGLISTEYHYSGTCAMTPQASGGVVGPRMKVHGTDNLRVVDTSVYPIVPSAHLQAVVYAVAERAADIIKGVI